MSAGVAMTDGSVRVASTHDSCYNGAGHATARRKAGVWETCGRRVGGGHPWTTTRLLGSAAAGCSRQHVLDLGRRRVGLDGRGCHEHREEPCQTLAASAALHDSDATATVRGVASRFVHRGQGHGRPRPRLDHGCSAAGRLRHIGGAGGAVGSRLLDPTCAAAARRHHL